MSKKLAQHTPGERFSFGNRVYEIFIDPTNDCEGCAFVQNKKCLSLECRAEERDDMQNVKYKCLGTVSDLKQ